MVHKNHVKGFTLIELVIVLAIASGLFATYGPQLIQQKIPLSQAEDASKDISKIKAAANAYYMENRAWPASVNELITTGYLPSTGVSPFGTNYTLGNNGQNLVVSVDTNREQIANMLAGNVSFGSVSADGETVSTEMGTPSRVAIQSFFLARRSVAGCADCNQLAPGTDLDINGNDLRNIDVMDANQATITNATITNADIDELAVEKIDLGVNSLTYVGNQLNLNAQTVSVNGVLLANSDVIGNGNNLTGFNTISANNGIFSDFTADTASINTLSGESLNFTLGVIDNLNGNSLSYARGSIMSIDGNNLNYDTGTIDTLEGNSLSFGTGNVASIVGNRLSYSSGTVNALDGDTLTYNIVNATNGIINYLNADYAYLIDLGVTGVANLNSFTALTGSVDDLTSSNATFDNVSFNSLSADSLLSSNANLAVVKATEVETNFLTTGTFSADSVNVSGNFSVGGTLNATNVTVSNKTSTNILQASTSNLGTASAGSLTVSGNVQANDVVAPKLTADTANVASLSGNSASFDSVTGNQFSGGAFNGSNFTTNVSSVNNNKVLIDQYVLKWNSCQSAGGCK